MPSPSHRRSSRCRSESCRTCPRRRRSIRSRTSQRPTVDAWPARSRRRRRRTQPPLLPSAPTMCGTITGGVWSRNVFQASVNGAPSTEASHHSPPCRRPRPAKRPSLDRACDPVLDGERTRSRSEAVLATTRSQALALSRSAAERYAYVWSDTKLCIQVRPSPCSRSRCPSPSSVPARGGGVATRVYAVSKNERAASVLLSPGRERIPCRKSSLSYASRGSSSVDPAMPTLRASAYVSCAQKRTYAGHVASRTQSRRTSSGAPACTATGRSSPGADRRRRRDRAPRCRRPRCTDRARTSQEDPDARCPRS